MADLSITNTFTSGTTISSSQMNTNFGDIETFVNGTGWVDEGRLGTKSVTSNKIGVLPYCRITRTSDQTLTTGVQTDISFNFVILDTESMWSAGDPTYITIPKDGIYSISACIQFGASTSGYRQLVIKTDSGTILSVERNSALSSSGTVVSTSTISPLTSGQKIRIAGTQTSGSNLDVVYVSQYTPVLCIAYIGNL